jgi:hypothetical protein
VSSQEPCVSLLRVQFRSVEMLPLMVRSRGRVSDSKLLAYLPGHLPSNR